MVNWRAVGFIVALLVAGGLWLLLFAAISAVK